MPCANFVFDQIDPEKKYHTTLTKATLKDLYGCKRKYQKAKIGQFTIKDSSSQTDTVHKNSSERMPCCASGDSVNYFAFVAISQLL